MESTEVAECCIFFFVMKVEFTCYLTGGSYNGDFNT